MSMYITGHETCYTLYHGAEWMILVERGWMTQYVHTLPNGARIAQMLYVGRWG